MVLHKLTKQVEDSKIQNASVLDANKELSEEFYHEREETDLLGINILNYFMDKDKKHVLVMGGKGSGKTAITMMLLAEAKTMYDDVSVEYINCIEHDTTRKIYKKISKNSKNDENSCTNKFIQFCKNQKKLVIVLDEVHLLRDDTIFYQVSRYTELDNVLLIMISNRPNIDSILSADTQSSLYYSVIGFKSYNSSDIYNILRKRAETSFLEVTDDDERVFRIIAARTSNVMISDVRVALKTMRNLYCSDMDKTQLNISSLMDVEDKNIQLATLRNLSDTQREILLCVAKYELTNVAYAKYIEQGLGSLSKKQFFKHVNELQRLGVVRLSDARVNQGLTKKVEVCVDSCVVDEYCGTGQTTTQHL